MGDKVQMLGDFRREEGAHGQKELLVVIVTLTFIYPELYRVDPLHDHTARGAASIANSGTAVFAWF